jgi:archaellum component FlaG (FlaF/FlaG flagellin family)
MNKTAIGLIALGIALIAAYLALQQPPAPPGGAATTHTTHATTPTTTTATATSQPPTTTAEKPETKTQTATPTSTAQPPRVVYAPSIEVAVEAPGVINTTRLPIYINYTIVVKNSGNGTGVAVVGGVPYEVAPGQVVRIAANKTAERAGEHSVEAVVNGTRHVKAVRVYYYAPRLQAEPVYINATKLPANLTVTVRVSNLGNLTAWVGGVAVAPGETKAINTTISVEAAGSYVVEMDGVEVPVTVRYYVAAFDWRVGGPSEVEALLGETYAAWLWIKNTGNATATLSIDGRAFALAPGEALNTTKTITVGAAGIYNVEFRVAGSLNATLRHAIRVKVVAPKVEIVLWSPEVRRGWPPPNGTDSTSLSAVSKTVALTWGYVITTNATRRAVALAVEGPGGVDYYKLAPGAAASKNYTETVQVPGEKTLEVKVNSTTYKLKVSLTLTPPKITVKDISRIEFTDSRSLLGLELRCGVIERTIDILRVTGTLTYTPTGRAVSGQITVKLIDTYTGDYRGKIEGGSGSLSLNVAGHNIYVEFTTSPLTITRVFVDGAPYSCDVPTALVPPILYREKPTATDEPVTQYVFRLLSAFARGDSDRPQSITWNGEYVEAVDKGGNTLRVHLGGGEIRIEGPLTAAIVISQ